MTSAPLEFILSSPGDTAGFARRIGRLLAAGDCLLLEGPIGAGKTHFARSLIQSQLELPEDVPSPTFTLVQTYDTPRFEIWHADLYRLSMIDEVEELGLTEAFETAVSLIEWPDRLGDYTPPGALHMTLTPGADPDTRTLTLDWSDPEWTPRLEALLR